MLRNILFLFRYAFRNITRNFFRTLSLFITIIMMSFIFLVTFTISDALNYSFRKNAEISYQNVDLEITFDSNSKGHIVRNEQLKAYSNYYDYYAGFYWLNTVMKTNVGEQSVNVLAGTTEELNNFIGTNLEHLQYNEVIITNSIAQELSLEKNSVIEIYVGNGLEQYVVRDIVSDTGIFSDSTILVQSNYLMKHHSNSLLGLSLGNVDDVSIVNRVYINLKDNINVDEFIKAINNSNLGNLVINKPTNVETQQANIDLIIGVVYGGLTVVIASMMFVLVSIINLRLQNMKNEMGIIETIGESKAYIFKVLLVEIIIFSLLGVFIAYLMCDVIYKLEFLLFFGRVGMNYEFDLLFIIGTFLLILITAIICVIHCYRKVSKVNIIDLAKNKQFEHVSSFKTIIIINLVLLVIFILKILFLDDFLNARGYALFTVVLTIVFGISLVSLFLKIVSKIVKFGPVFNHSFLKNLSLNRTKHNSLKILLICLFGITMAFSLINTLNTEINKIENGFNIDTALINISGYHKSMIKDLKQVEGVNNVCPGIFYQDVITPDQEHSFKMLFSCSIEESEVFMDFDFPDNIVEEFKNPHKKYIVVMDNFLKVTDYQVGDTLRLKIGEEFVDYEIITGTNICFQQFAYTNDYYIENTTPNALIIDNDYDNKEAMSEFNLVVRTKYGTSMNYLLNCRETIEDLFSRFKMALSVVYVVLGIIILSFLLTIINNTILIFKEMKYELALLQILGTTPGYLNKMIIQEMFISFLVILIPYAYMTISLYSVFGGFSLIFGYFIELEFSWILWVFSFVLGIGMFILSYLYYFIGVKNINLCRELKN